MVNSKKLAKVHLLGLLFLQIFIDFYKCDNNLYDFVWISTNFYEFVQIGIKYLYKFVEKNAPNKCTLAKKFTTLDLCLHLSSRLFGRTNVVFIVNTKKDVWLAFIIKTKALVMRGGNKHVVSTSPQWEFTGPTGHLTPFSAPSLEKRRPVRMKI